MTRSQPQPTHRTFSDGSINTAYYQARGRQLRSMQAHRLTKAGARKLPALRLVALICIAVLLILPAAT